MNWKNGIFACVCGLTLFCAAEASAQESPTYTNVYNIPGLGSEQFRRPQHPPQMRRIIQIPYRQPRFAVFPQQSFQPSEPQEGIETRQEHARSAVHYHAENRREVHVAGHPAQKICCEDNLPENWHVYNGQ